MNNIKDYVKFIINSNLYEKFFINFYKKKNNIDFYDINKIIFSYTINSKKALSNPFSVMNHISLLEQLSGQKLVHHKSTKYINEFNLKKDQYIGSSTILKNKKLYDFLIKLITVYQNSNKNLNGFIEKFIFNDNTFTIGFNNLDCFETSFTNFEKWALLPDSNKYGLNIHIVNNCNNSLINEIFLSHLNIKIL